MFSQTCNVKKLWYSTYCDDQQQSTNKSRNRGPSTSDSDDTAKNLQPKPKKGRKNNPTRKNISSLSSPSKTLSPSPSSSSKTPSPSPSPTSSSPTSYPSDTPSPPLPPSPPVSPVETTSTDIQNKVFMPCQITILESNPNTDHECCPPVAGMMENSLVCLRRDLLPGDMAHKWEGNDELDLVAIGPNGTLVATKFLISLDWTVGSQVTRKLLSQLFDRETLATHSLSGKPSPAFQGRERPQKQQLNPQIVVDIIHAVSKYCNCSEREVRSAITTKCADENKMIRNRKKKDTKNKENASKVANTQKNE